jgi:hypothetical protein
MSRKTVTVAMVVVEGKHSSQVVRKEDERLGTLVGLLNSSDILSSALTMAENAHLAPIKTGRLRFTQTLINY